MNFFATVQPGLGRLLQAEVTKRGLGEVAGIGYDGRNDVVWFEGRSSSELLDLRTSDDVFVESTTVKAGDSRPDRLAALLLDLKALDKALSVRASLVAPLRGKMSARVIARVLKEDRFLRTELRDAGAHRLSQIKPRWTSADPADLELWMLEALPGVFKCGVRLSSAEMRQHGGRSVERAGALRPTVAAAMVSLAGDPSSQPLLDPFCGSGRFLLKLWLPDGQ